MSCSMLLKLKMFFLPFLVYYLALFKRAETGKNIEIEFIKDYLNKQLSPGSVTSLLCWDNDDQYKLAKMLNENFHKSNIQRFSKHFKFVFQTTDNNIYLIDLSCKNISEILQQANIGYQFRVPNHWVLLEDQENHEDLFGKLNLFVDTHVVLVQKLGHNFSLKYLYKLDKKSKIIYDQFGQWSLKEGFLNFDETSLSWRRRNINQHTIRASMVITENSSYDHLDDYRFNEIDTPTKLNYVFTNAVLDYMNASKKFIYYSTWYNTNSRDQNGTLIGSLLNREIDITGTPFFCKPERLSWMDCVAMTTPAKGFFIFRQPPLSYVKNIYILPFGKDLWLTDISFLFLSAVLLYFVVIWEWKIITDKEESPDFDMIYPTFSDSLLFTMGAVCQQGYATEPKGAPGKILILTVFITLIFLFTAYTAYTVVLFQATADDIKTIEDLYESDIELGGEDKPYIREIFSKFTEPLRKKIYLEKIAPKGQKPHLYPLKEGIEKMKNEYFAFHIDQISGYKVIQDTFLESEKCGLREITNFIFETNPWIVSPKNVPFKEIFTIGYRKLTDSGLYKREIKKRISHKPECTSQENSFRSAGLLDLYSVYMLLIIGIVCSIIILCIEVLTFKIALKHNFKSF